MTNSTANAPAVTVSASAGGIALLVLVFLLAFYIATPSTTYGTLTCSANGTLIYQRGPHHYHYAAPDWISVDAPRLVYRQPEGADCSLTEE